MTTYLLAVALIILKSLLGYTVAKMVGCLFELLDDDTKQ